MASKYLLDSTILIDHLKGIRQATEWLSKLDDNEALISVITRAEVLVKASEKWEEVTALLDEYACLPIGPDEADIAAGLRLPELEALSAEQVVTRAIDEHLMGSSRLPR